jgi:hypothetical protein
MTTTIATPKVLTEHSDCSVASVLLIYIESNIGGVERETMIALLTALATSHREGQHG